MSHATKDCPEKACRLKLQVNKNKGIAVVDAQRREEYADSTMVLMVGNQLSCIIDIARDFFEEYGSSEAGGFPSIWEHHLTRMRSNANKQTGGTWTYNEDPNWDKHWSKQLIPDGQNLMMLMFPSEVPREVYLKTTGHEKRGACIRNTKNLRYAWSCSQIKRKMRSSWSNISTYQ